ncbi:MAG: M28 family metallopeptidase [Friedmanniella sp.]
MSRTALAVSPAVQEIPATPTAALAERLAREVTAFGAAPHLAALQAIADAHQGNRAVGTGGYAASVDYLAGVLQRAGFDVQTPTFSYPQEVVEARRLSIGDVDVAVNRLGRSIDTPPAGLTGPLVALPPGAAGGCAKSDFEGLPTQDAVLLVRRGGCTFRSKAERAAAAGGIALVVVNEADTPLTGATLGAPAAIPVGGVSRSDGDALTRRAGQPATIDLRSRLETRTSRNVLAQTRTGRPDSVVMAGAHLDSVPAGPGINDNGSGVAGLLEVALQLGSTPEASHAVRFAWWGAEEVGLLGSEAYVAGLSAGQRHDIELYLNADMIASPNPGFFVYDGDDSAREGAGPGPPGSAGIERTLTDYLSRHGVASQPTDFDGRSDYGPFIRAGIPAGGLFSGAEETKSRQQAGLWGGEAGEPFDPCYHQACDNLRNLDDAAFDRHLDALAWAIGSYAADPVDRRPDGDSGAPPPTWALAPARRTRVVLGVSTRR